MTAAAATAGAPPEAINYSREVGWAGVVMAEFSRQGPSFVLVTFNHDGRPQIGRYRSALSAEQFGRALADVRASGYQQIDPGGPFSPEAKFVIIGERGVAQPLPQVRAFDIRRLPDPIVTLTGRLDALVATIAAHPERVIEGQATWAAASFSPHQPILMQVALKNVGTLPLTLPTPLGFGRDEWTGLRLSITDGAPDGDDQMVDLTGAQVGPAPGGAADRQVTLDPGHTLRFIITKRVFLTPGTYTAELSLTIFPPAAADPQTIGGELLLALAPLEIRAA
jgi:hypothetical protein